MSGTNRILLAESVIAAKTRVHEVWDALLSEHSVANVLAVVETMGAAQVAVDRFWGSLGIVAPSEAENYGAALRRKSLTRTGH